jgi:hypothetical protein
MSDNVLDMYQHVAMDNSGITTADLDAKVKEMAEARADYEAKKQVSTDAYKDYQAKQFELMEMLKRCGKTEYKAEGLGTARIIMKKSTKIPSTPDAKKQMLQWFREELGETGYLNMVGIPSNTLNSFINKQLEEDPDFKIPGVGDQKITEEIRFTKTRRKS